MYLNIKRKEEENGIGDGKVIQIQNKKNQLKISRPRVVLQKRDLEIMSVIYDHGFILPEHLSQFFFRGLRQQTLWDRIDVLIRGGILRREFPPYMFGGYLYKLTPNGEHMAGLEKGSERPSYFNDVQAVVHDSKVINVRLRLKFDLAPENDFTAEKDFKEQDADYIPDGIISGEASYVALELENSRKNKQRYIETLANIASDAGITHGLYIVSFKPVENVLLQLISHMRLSDKIGVISYDEFMSTPAPQVAFGERLVRLSEILR